MFCPECGKQIEEDALFCPECGTALPNNQQPRSIEDESPVQNCEIATTREVDAETATSETEVSPNNATNENGQSGSANASMPQSGTTQPTPSGETTGTKAGKVIDDAIDKFKSLDKTKKYGILGGGIAVVVLVAIVAFVMPLFGGVPTDVARQAFAQSSLATNGAVSNNYTNESAYEIKDFKIDKQEDALAGYDSDTRQMAKAWYGTDQLKIVYFSGTIANDSFETNFTGECDFKNVNGTWSKASDYSLTIDSKSTKPLKGVDTLGGGKTAPAAPTMQAIPISARTSMNRMVPILLTQLAPLPTPTGSQPIPPRYPKALRLIRALAGRPPAMHRPPTRTPNGR